MAPGRCNRHFRQRFRYREGLAVLRWPPRLPIMKEGRWSSRRFFGYFQRNDLPSPVNPAPRGIIVMRHWLRLSFALGLLAFVAWLAWPAAAQGPGKPQPEFEELDKFVADAEEFDGGYKLYRKKDRLYLRIEPRQLEKPFLFLVSIAQGIGVTPLLGGYTLGGDDDPLLYFKRVDNRILLIRKNIRFRADPAKPEGEAVRQAYSDSVVASLRIVAGSGNSILIDFTDFLYSDPAEIALVLRQTLGGFYRLDPSRSMLGRIKNFPNNAEIQLTATYGGEANRGADTVADTRGVTLTMHYSLTTLPETGYKPRLADDRVGYFLTAIKDYSRPADESAFVRYIHRWHLEKADPQAEKSPPKKPIIFYIERTVPHQYRQHVRDGILEWNKAFEKAGFINAIEVRNQLDSDDWDPEDVRYTTFRWMTASAGFAMGPSRVNPLTGQIFDADIIFDADFIRVWQMEWQRYHNPLTAAEPSPSRLGWNEARRRQQSCQLFLGRAADLAFASTVLMARDLAPGGRVPEELIAQALKETVMHEVGHTLGLRHNFKASTMLKPHELNDTTITRTKGLSGSVMDYNAVNIAPKGTKQGDYYSTTIGPYDYWAIEYGYREFASGEAEGLKKIAARASERDLAFATDEDTRGSFDPDPLSNRFDMGQDVLDFARRQFQLFDELVEGKLVERAAADGKGYQRLRQMFWTMIFEYARDLDFVARFVGGAEFTRNHKGDPNAKPPFQVVDPKQQRAALQLLKERAFSDRAFRFSPELLNSLAPERWSHWGTESMPLDERLDFPIHQAVLLVQTRALNRLFSPLTLTRLLDNEQKVKDADPLTLPEVFNEVTAAIWSELEVKEVKEASNARPLISSFRRALQREHLNRLITLTLRPTGVPEDARTQAWAQLRKLHKKIVQFQDFAKEGMDEYSQWHLSEAKERIERALRSTFQQGG
jgi:hypothetical protein